MCLFRYLYVIYKRTHERTPMHIYTNMGGFHVSVNVYDPHTFTYSKLVCVYMFARMYMYVCITT